MRGGVGGRGGGRIPKNRSIAPTPARKGYAAGGGAASVAASRRESDASLCSNRLSSVSLAHTVPCPPISDRSYQSAALRSVNAYLASISSATLRPPLPSARDITKAFDDVLSRLDWPTPVGIASVLEDDLPSILSSLRCPVKLSKSALKAPGTPHSWPPLLAALHWLVQLARYSEYPSSSPSFAEGNNVLQYHFQSFALFMEGDDDAVEALDQEQLRQTEEHVAKIVAAVESLEKEAADLERRAEAIRSGPSPREAIERERSLLKDDTKKFEVMIESWKDKLTSAEKLLKEKEEGLDAKIKEKQRISEENEPLKQRIFSQVMNVRDAERTKKELQAMERDTAEAEIGRNVLEEKSWELDADAGRKMKELESLVEQTNHCIKKFKLGCDFQYVLNAEGSSASEVLCKDYKTVLKPFLNEAADETKTNSVAKFEEKISLQQRSRENSFLLDERKGRLSALQKTVDEAEARSISLKRDVDEHASRCSAEAENAVKESERMEQEDLLEREKAHNFLKESDVELNKTMREVEEEIQTSAGELVALIDDVSGYKEFMELLVGRMHADLSETAQAGVDAHKASLSAKLVSASQNSSLCGSKRAHALLTN